MSWMNTYYRDIPVMETLAGLWNPALTMREFVILTLFAPGILRVTTVVDVWKDSEETGTSVKVITNTNIFKC